MKSIKTLVSDIQELIQNGKDFSQESLDALGRNMAECVRDSLSTSVRDNYLRISNLGTPCLRKLWYSINTPDQAETLPAAAKFKYLYGHLLERLVLFLAKESGHTVTGEQAEVNLHGVPGHKDAIIDGHLVDAKSASSYSFRKFKEHGLGEDDPFGYLTQLNAYLEADQTNPELTDKKSASFLAIDKTLGHIILDTWGKDRVDYKRKVEAAKSVLAQKEPPERGYTDKPMGKSGNRCLDVACSYCDFKRKCWPGLQIADYSGGPVFMTKIVRSPKVGVS